MRKDVAVKNGSTSVCFFLNIDPVGSGWRLNSRACDIENLNVFGSVDEAVSVTRDVILKDRDCDGRFLGPDRPSMARRCRTPRFAFLVGS